MDILVVLLVGVIIGFVVMLSFTPRTPPVVVYQDVPDHTGGGCLGMLLLLLMAGMVLAALATP